MPSAIRKPRTGPPRQPQTAKARELRDAALRDAMANLIRNPHFGLFIDLMREHKDAAVADMINDAVVGNDRLFLAAAGEVRTYLATIQSYDEAFLKLSEETQNVEPFAPQG